MSARTPGAWTRAWSCRVGRPLVACGRVGWAAAVALALGAPSAAGQEPDACEPTVTLRGAPSRTLPQAFFNQAMQSIPAMHPDHEMLAGRPLGRVGDVEYALVAYRESPGAPVVIASLGVHWASERSWYVESECGSDDWIPGLIRTLEVLGGLAAVPGG